MTEKEIKWIKDNAKHYFNGKDINIDGFIKDLKVLKDNEDSSKNVKQDDKKPVQKAKKRKPTRRFWVEKFLSNGEGWISDEYDVVARFFNEEQCRRYCEKNKEKLKYISFNTLKKKGLWNDSIKDNFDEDYVWEEFQIWCFDEDECAVGLDIITPFI